MSTLADKLAARAVPAPERRVIVCTGNSTFIAERNPDAIVINVAASSIRYKGDVFYGIGKGYGKNFQKPLRRFQYLVAIILNVGKLLADEDALAAIYADDLDGGPLDSSNILSAFRTQLAPKFQWLEIDVARHYGHGIHIAFTRPASPVKRAA